MGIRVPTYLRGKTREIELVMSLTSCQGILTSFFPRKTDVIELVTIITSNHFIFPQKNLVKLNRLQFLHHCMAF